jgi:hypothetical protein
MSVWIEPAARRATVPRRIAQARASLSWPAVKNVIRSSRANDSRMTVARPD